MSIRSVTSALAVPAGIAFPLHELIYARAWAERRGLSQCILLDQIKDGQEFEEVLVVRRHVPNRRALVIWRQPNAVIVQAEGGQGRRFLGLHAALAHAGGLLATRRGQGAGWLKLLGRFPRE